MRRRQEHACTTHGLQADSLLTENLDLSWNDFTIGSGHIEGYGGRRGSRYLRLVMSVGKRPHGAYPGRQRLLFRLSGDGGQRVDDPPFAQLQDRLPEQVVDAVEVAEQHLVRSACGPRRTPERVS